MNAALFPQLNTEDEMHTYVHACIYAHTHVLYIHTHTVYIKRKKAFKDSAKCLARKKDLNVQTFAAKAAPI